MWRAEHRTAPSNRTAAWGGSCEGRQRRHTAACKHALGRLESKARTGSNTERSMHLLQSGQHRANQAERQRQVLEQHQRLARLERHKLKLRGDDVLWHTRQGERKVRDCSATSGPGPQLQHSRQAGLPAGAAGWGGMLASRPIHRRQYTQSCPV